MVIYPRVESIQRFIGGNATSAPKHIHLKHETWIRKLHTDGKQYLCQFIHENTMDSNEKTITTDTVMSLHRFHVEVYWFIISGIVIPGQKNIFEELVVKLDYDQRSELERVNAWL